jgi:V-type H+-transporting ATPase subunit a
MPLIDNHGVASQALGMVAISYMAGTIAKDESLRFKKMVFRATRGKALTYFRDLDTQGLADYSGQLDKKLRTVYVIVFQEGPHFRSRLTKICDSFMGRSVEIPHALGQAELARRIIDIGGRIIEARHIIGLTRLRLKDYLKEM